MVQAFAAKSLSIWKIERLSKRDGFFHEAAVIDFQVLIVTGAEPASKNTA